MAYQDVKRALTRLSHPAGDHIDQTHQWLCFFQLYEAYNQLSQEVILCHNRIQNGSFAVPGLSAADTITLAAPMPDATYSVSAIATTLNGWNAFAKLTIGSRTTTAFGLTYSAAAPAGGGSLLWMVIG